MTVLQLLLPGRAEVGNLTTDPEPTVQALADLYAYPEPVPVRGWVRANMVSTLDGSASGPDGVSGTLGGAVDKATFGVLRGLSDVVLVGAGTVRAENYGAPTADPAFAERRRARGQRPAPALAVVTRSGDVPTGNGVFEGSSPTFVITTARADLARLRDLAGPDQVIVAGDDDVDTDDAVRVLAGRGYRRILLEGGPSLLGHSLAAGTVDELCLTWAPVLVAGSGPRIAVGPGADVTARPAHLIAAGDVLLGRWLVQHVPNN
ncbi:dihydrofolate reductase family protein [Kineosporia sp. J2-2]|uniref:Dihydrofolate reductase family protein n=1 Tax=Kineosporia corallincola TaxID=2835133 RepID=A0ABS5TDK1_9ACTN|nr:dihydrofolate reductase family protein [Kineosporia corallincola]MBT0769173.1 dihydrofolate reductase family protein [Kineosporia corallincola]